MLHDWNWRPFVNTTTVTIPPTTYHSTTNTVWPYLKVCFTDCATLFSCTNQRILHQLLTLNDLFLLEIDNTQFELRNTTCLIKSMDNKNIAEGTRGPFYTTVIVTKRSPGKWRCCSLSNRGLQSCANSSSSSRRRCASVRIASPLERSLVPLSSLRQMRARPNPAVVINWNFNFFLINCAIPLLPVAWLLGLWWTRGNS